MTTKNERAATTASARYSGFQETFKVMSPQAMTAIVTLPVSGKKLKTVSTQSSWFVLQATIVFWCHLSSDQP